MPPTDPDRHAHIAALFEAVVDLPASERSARLDASCGRDTALRRDVERLLAADRAPAPLDTPPPLSELEGPPSFPPPTVPAPTTVHRGRRRLQAVTLIALVLLAGMTWLTRIALDSAAEQRERAEALRAFAHSILNAATPLAGADGEPTMGDLLASVEARLELDLDRVPHARADMEVALGAARRARGELAAAEPLLEAALERAEAAGLTAGSTARHARIELARLRVDQGRAAAAVALVRPAVDELRAADGTDAATTLDAANLLGWALYSDGQTTEAAAVLEETLRRREYALGEDDEDTLLTRTNLALVQIALAEFEAAQALAERAVAGYARTLGPRHPTTLYAQHVEARTLAGRGRFADAATREAEVVEIAADVLGPAHPYVLYWRTVLAGDLRRAGAIDEAAAQIQTVVDTRRTLISGGRGNLVEALLELATLQRIGLRLAEAELTAREALRIASEMTPPPVRLIWWSRLAVGLAVAQQEGRSEEGAELLRALDAAMVEQGATPGELQAAREKAAPFTDR